MGALFTEREARALAPAQRLKPSQWSEEYRFLPATVAAEPGKYRGSRTPYIAGIVDAAVEPVEEIILLKAAQVGFTTALQNLIGWAIDCEPAPMLVVMPNEKEAGKLVEENLRPLIEDTPKLAQHLTGDKDAITKDGLILDSMPIYMGWAGSAQSLARRACRYVFLDEVDKYPPFSGRDADPISLARARARTYLHRKKIIIGSTPTTRAGAIWKAFQDCGDRRYFFVPCPHCGEYQRLTFPHVRFDSPDVKAIEDKVARAEYIELNRKAHYECQHCREAIVDIHKAKMLATGVWLSETQTIDKHGTISGERPRAKRVGFHISALYSPWVTFSAMAAQFVRATGDVGAMMEFRNQWLGEVFEDVVTKVKVDDLRNETWDAGLVPRWAGVLIASADTQDNSFFYVIRAWGRTKSQLIAHGEALTFEELKTICLDNCYQVAGTKQVMAPRLMLIDSGGHRTSEVYQFSLRDPRIFAIRGNPNRASATIVRNIVAKELGVVLHSLDTNYFKDQLAAMRVEKRWLINAAAAADERYLQHLASEHKVFDKEKGRVMWKTVTDGAANHFLDCEVYNQAGAQLAQVIALPDEATMEKQREEPAEAAQASPEQAGGDNPWVKKGKSWLAKKDGWSI